MKKNGLLILALAPCALFAQSDYQIKGKVGKLDAPAKVYLIQYEATAMKIDSAFVKKGVFEFSGKVSDPAKATLILDHQGVGMNKNGLKPDGLEIFLEKGQINVSSPDSLKNAKITGSALNEENAKYRAFLKPGLDKMTKLMNDYQTASKEKKEDKTFMDDINGRYMGIQTELAKLNDDYVKAHTDSYLSLEVMKNYGGGSPDVATLEPMFNLLSERLRQTEAGKGIQLKITQLKLTAVGSTAPDFTQMDQNDKPVKLSDFKGKYVLVDFWASWCGPCRGENPNVVKAYNQYKDKGFAILGVSLDENREKWLEAIAKDQLTWSHVSDLKGWKNEVAAVYQIRSIPSNVLINPEGVIVAKNLRGEELIKELERIFAE